jgi:hypothetical protein
MISMIKEHTLKSDAQRKRERSLSNRIKFLKWWILKGRLRAALSRKQ